MKSFTYLCISNNKTMLDTQKILAKSKNKITLETHSKNVSIISERILKTFYPSLYDELSSPLKIASILHDIGKATSHFQKILKKNQDEDDIKKIKHTHNIISWAWVVTMIKGQGLKNEDLIFDAILWHHGVYNYDESITASSIVKSELTKEDISVLLEMSNHLLSLVNIKIIKPLSRSLNLTPYYDNGLMDDFSCLKTIMRGILLFSDRFVSSLEDNEVDFNIVSFDEYVNKSKVFNINDLNINDERSKKQIEITETIDNSEKNTFIVKAPAGFGKTRVGLLWSLVKPKKLIWVAPRNDVSVSLYHSVTKELKKLGVNSDDIKVTCYFSNDVQLGHNNMDEADIIITNIDSFLGNSFKSNKLYNLALINTTDVIFDEFHELVCSDGIFSLFTHILKVRNTYTNAKTLLLSATPIDIEHLINENDLFFPNPTTAFEYLPSKSTHYNAQHNKPYNVTIGNFAKTIAVKPNTLAVCNSIAQTQKYGHDYNFTHIYHSEFTSEDRKRIINDILTTFGENSTNQESNLVGARVLQSSLDISLNEMYEMVLSPESTLQRIGRVNRWGEKDYAKLFLTSFTENSDDYHSKEKSSVERGYTLTLHKLWYKFLKDNCAENITLDEFYKIYNDFYSLHTRESETYVSKLLTKSIDRIVNIFPRRRKNIKSNILILNSPDSLRGNGKGLFYTCKYVNDRQRYITPITKEIYGDEERFFENEFNESDTHRNVIRRQIPLLEKFGFDYSNLDDYKTATIKQFRRNANNILSPYYRCDVVYDDKYGVIEIDGDIYNTIFITTNPSNLLDVS